MKKVILLIAVIVTLVFSITSFKDDSVYIATDTLSKSFITKHIPIIDIRTQREWRETGVVANSQLITFYNDDKTINEESFMKKLQKVVRKRDTFAILCRTGNRANRVSRYLNSKGYTHVISLSGGIKMGIKNGVELIHG
ncbi:MAG: rhodanese-related sulfurtransferase [Sulfurimonas sp.]|jgi:rhodanese-related sulfurtransferase